MIIGSTLKKWWNKIGEMVQWVQVFAAKPEDLNLFSRTHMTERINFCKLSSWLPHVCHDMIYILEIEPRAYICSLNTFSLSFSFIKKKKKKEKKRWYTLVSYNFIFFFNDGSYRCKYVCVTHKYDIRTSFSPQKLCNLSFIDLLGLELSGLPSSASYATTARQYFLKSLFLFF